MSDLNQTPDVSLPDDFAQYEALMNEGRLPAKADADTQEPSDATPAKAVDETAADSETADDLEQDETAGDKQPKKGGFKRRIDKLNGRIQELERQLAGKSAVASDEGTNREPEAKSVAPTTDEPKFEDVRKKPTMDDFDSIEEFTEALTDWKFEKREFDSAQKTQAEKAQAQAKTLATQWDERTEAAKEVHPDYDAVLSSVDDIQLSAAHQRLLLESEHGPELAYTLAKDPELLEKFAGLPPVRAARELGRLEAKLPATPAAPTVAAPKPETRRVSAAPKPIRPVQGQKPTSKVSTDIYDADLAQDFNAWEAQRNAQLYRAA